MVFDRTHSGEMPPDGDSQPKSKPYRSFLDAIAAPIHRELQNENRVLGRVRSRRLNRIEYENTIHDLLGIDIPLQNELPEDTYHDGFSTVAMAQQVLITCSSDTYTPLIWLLMKRSLAR